MSLPRCFLLEQLDLTDEQTLGWGFYTRDPEEAARKKLSFLQRFGIPQTRIKLDVKSSKLCTVS